MEKASMSSYKAQVEKYGTPISDELYKQLRNYANKNSIKLSGFKDYVGDICTIKTVIDDIVEIAKDFPRILDEKQGVWLELDYNLGSDFATSNGGHIIHLNGGYFAEVEMLDQEYKDGVKCGRFVKGTDWRAIARHETGHVVANLYSIDPMQIAMDILNTKSYIIVTEYLKKELSRYSVEYKDGREIISESFSAYYSKVGNSFAEEFVRKVGELNEIV